MAAPALIDVEIQSIAAGGDGVGRAEGMVVFVPRTAPGDLARVRAKASRRFARGTLVELLRAGPGRIEPPCPHYVLDDCGGCGCERPCEAPPCAVGRDPITRDSRCGVPRLSQPGLALDHAQDPLVTVPAR